MNGSEVQKISSEYKNTEIAILNKDDNNIEYTCMSCNKIVSDIRLHLKIDHNMDCFQIVNDQNENISIDTPQNDIKNEILDDYDDDAFDNVSLTELDGYLPASDYSILKGECRIFFTCKNCNSNFESFVDLKDHSIVQHNNLIQRRDCKHCNKMLDSHKSLMEHLKEHHSACKQLNKIQKILNQFKNNSGTLKNENFDRCYYCTECSKTFRLKSSLIIHQRKMHSTGKFSSKDGKISFWCLECQLNFSDIKDLRRHQNDNHGERTFVCLTCDTIFPSRGSLNLHNIYHHRLHWCSICNIAFPGRLAVTSHVKQKHPGMPVYRANSRFVCEYCSQSFSVRSQLADHIQSVHLGLVNRCEDCGKILATSETLKVHRLKHQPEMHRTCEHCGRQFYRTGMLTEHIRACHPEALPEDWRLNTTCPYCHTSFTRRESMRRHIEAKHEPKNLSCSFCERLFTCRRYLVRHENKHHLQRRTAL